MPKKYLLFPSEEARTKTFAFPILYVLDFRTLMSSIVALNSFALSRKAKDSLSEFDNILATFKLILSQN